MVHLRLGMRLWSLHPQYMDAKGLVALWREGLLARKVLMGETKGYRYHPQLVRFKELCNPVAGMRLYLHHVYREALTRNYKFDASKIGVIKSKAHIDVTVGQLEFEKRHLLAKLKARAPDLYAKYEARGLLAAHPMFRVVDGAVAEWEIVHHKS